MIIKIETSNTELHSVLYKNPTTDKGVFAKQLKKGVVIGLCRNSTRYDCLFQDTKYSYVGDFSDQIDYQNHCSPAAILNIVSELFPHLLKSKEEIKNVIIPWLNKHLIEIDSLPCTITVENLEIGGSWVRDGKFLLGRYIRGIEVVHKTGELYSLSITRDSIYEAMNVLAIIALFGTIVNKKYDLFVLDELLIKYIKVLTNIKNVPYFIFYLFIKRAIKSKQQFERVREPLEAYFDGNIKFCYEDTQGSRIIAILSHLCLDEDILDVGCGELSYFKALRRKFKKKFIAHDTEDYSEFVDKLIKEDKADNLSWLPSLDLLDPSFNGQIILSEVIEHNTKEETLELLAKLKAINFTRLIITSPNFDFNQYYEMDTEYRHSDHKYEMTNREFKALINSTFAGYFIEISGCGDDIGGKQPTQIAVIIKC